MIEKGDNKGRRGRELRRRMNGRVMNGRRRDLRMNMVRIVEGKSVDTDGRIGLMELPGVKGEMEEEEEVIN